MIFLKFKIRFLILTLLKSRIWFWIFTYCKPWKSIMSFWIITHCMIATSASDTDHQTKSQIWLLILNFQNQKNDFGIYKFKIQNLILFLDFEGGGRLHHFHIYSNDIWLSKSKIWFCILYFQNQKTDFGIYKFKIQNLILVLDFEGGWASASLSYIF